MKQQSCFLAEEWCHGDKQEISPRISFAEAPIREEKWLERGSATDHRKNSSPAASVVKITVRAGSKRTQNYLSQSWVGLLCSTGRVG